MKVLLKTLLSVILHPLIGSYIFLNGTRHFYLGKRLICSHYMNHLRIEDNFYLGNDARLLFISEYHGKKHSPLFTIGQGVNIGNRFSGLCAESVEIGSRTLIASDVFITDYNHGMNIEEFTSYGDTELLTNPVKIGRGCWIGEKSIILPGVQLGDRCIVGAGSVVTRSFPENTIIAGVPAKIVKQYDFNTNKWINVRK